MNQAKKYREKLEPIAEILGIKLAPLEQMMTYYPDQFMIMDFSEEENGAPNARKEYSSEYQKKLIKAFRSHDWLVYSDIYGHDGLSCGGSCKTCGLKFKFPKPDIDPPEDEKSSDKQNWRRKFRSVSDDFILAYHYVYGQHKRFGGRIKKCRGKK